MKNEEEARLYEDLHTIKDFIEEASQTLKAQGYIVSEETLTEYIDKLIEESFPQIN